MAAETAGRERSILEQVVASWDDDRRDAFVKCYAVMRAVDDVVDDRRAKGVPIARMERKDIERQIALMLRGNSCSVPGDFRDVCKRLRIPVWPWRHWLSAMRYDLAKGFFPDYRSFLKYAEGAAVAPGAIFMHLCAIRRDNDRYLPPRFDVRRASRPLALFCYHVHIMRDMKEDAADGIIFIPDDLLHSHDLDRGLFTAAVLNGEKSASLSSIIAVYIARAEQYREASRVMLDASGKYLEARYMQSLTSLFSMYCALFEKIKASR